MGILDVFSTNADSPESGIQTDVLKEMQSSGSNGSQGTKQPWSPSTNGNAIARHSLREHHHIISMEPSAPLCLRPLQEGQMVTEGSGPNILFSGFAPDILKGSHRHCKEGGNQG